MNDGTCLSNDAADLRNGGVGTAGLEGQGHLQIVGLISLWNTYAPNSTNNAETKHTFLRKCGNMYTFCNILVLIEKRGNQVTKKY